MTIFVTRKEIEDFILSQPNSRPIRFYQNRSSCEIGCLMAQYGNKHSFGHFVCTFDKWHDSDLIKQQSKACSDGWSFGSYGIKHKTYRTLKISVLLKKALRFIRIIG